MGVLPQALEIIFEVQQMKRSNEKITRKIKKLSNLQTIFFSFFFSLNPSYFQSF
jgi:hypothetical protein